MSASGGAGGPHRDDAEERRRARSRGIAAEAWVASELTAAGYRVLARNWRGGGAEIDLVVERAGALRFVEVKARGPGDDIGMEVITDGKCRRLARGAEAFLAQWPSTPVEACFAVALVHVDGGEMTMEWLDDAFDA